MMFSLTLLAREQESKRERAEDADAERKRAATGVSKVCVLVCWRGGHVSRGLLQMPDWTCGFFLG